MIKLLSSDATIFSCYGKKNIDFDCLPNFRQKKNVVIISYFFLCVYRPLNSMIGLVSSQLDPS